MPTTDTPITSRDITMFKSMIARFENHLPVVIAAYDRGHTEELRRHQQHPLYQRISKSNVGHSFDIHGQIQFDTDEILSWEHENYGGSYSNSLPLDMLLMSEMDAYEAGAKSVRDNLERLVAQEREWAKQRAESAARQRAHTVRAAVASAAKTAYKEQRRAARMAAQD